MPNSVKIVKHKNEDFSSMSDLGTKAIDYMRCKDTYNTILITMHNFL